MRLFLATSDVCPALVEGFAVRHVRGVAAPVRKRVGLGDLPRGVVRGQQRRRELGVLDEGRVGGEEKSHGGEHGVSVCVWGGEAKPNQSAECSIAFTIAITCRLKCTLYSTPRGEGGRGRPLCRRKYSVLYAKL